MRERLIFVSNSSSSNCIVVCNRIAPKEITADMLKSKDIYCDPGIYDSGYQGNIYGNVTSRKTVDLILQHAKDHKDSPDMGEPVFYVVYYFVEDAGSINKDALPDGNLLIEHWDWDFNSPSTYETWKEFFKEADVK